MKHCLVLGANGFIGSHIVDALAEAGHSARAFDRYQTSDQPKFKKGSNVEVFKGDIHDAETLAAALKDVDLVFHCFSATTPFSSDNDPTSDIEKNLLPTVGILQQCVGAGVKKVMFVSSGGSIYGHTSEERPATEDDVPGPVSPYGVTKLAIEGYLAYFQRKFGLDYTVYRLSNPYGPRQAFRNNQGVIPAFISQIENGETLHIYGDGSASRDYIYIIDAAQMMVRAIDNETKHRLYNIGSGQQTTLQEILSSLRDITGKDFEVEYQDAPKTFLTKAQISIDRYVYEFGKPDFTSLEDGLKATLNSR